MANSTKVNKKAVKNENKAPQGEKKHTSMRNAFIRVSKVNDTEQGQIVYDYATMQQILEEWALTKSMKYYLKDHNNEPDDPNPHYHIVICFGSPTPFDQIKAKFPYGKIEKPHNKGQNGVKVCVQYLVHMNDQSKKQYDFNEIITNDPNIDNFRILTQQMQVIKLEEYIDKIASGQIREHNLTDFIEPEVFANYKTRILNALEYYRRKVMTNKDRNIQVLAFTGETGTFKTTYAKQYAKNLNKSICISSSSNDPMQDYKGEDVLVLDDIRDDTFKFNDLLKILDNHTSSTVASRYSNKAFIGDTIIITSSIGIVDWYYDLPQEDKAQLKRRIPLWYQFTADQISIFEYSPKAKIYKFVASIPNVNNFTPQEYKSAALDVLKAMGVEMTPEVEKQLLEPHPDNPDSRLKVGAIWEDEVQNKQFGSQFTIDLEPVDDNIPF